MPAPTKDSSKGQADKAQPESSKSKRTTVKAEAYFKPAVEFVRSQGKTGATLKQIASALKLSGRVVHNLGWRLEGSPEIHEGKSTKLGSPRKPDEVQLRRRGGTGRSVVYEIAPKRARATRKAPAKATAKAS
jgi:hypothetical protein